MPRTILCLAALLAALAAVRAQQPPVQAGQRFRAGVDLVVIDASVLDANRRPVRDLTAGDFTLLEDGRPQAIKTFHAVNLPDIVAQAPVSWMREVQPDVSRNDTLTDRRVVVLVLDDSTPMMAEEVPLVRRMARRVIEQLAPSDSAAVVYTFNTQAGQGFTSDRTRLLAAVDAFNGGIDKTPAPGPYNPDPLLQKTDVMTFDRFDPQALQLYASVVGTLRTLSERLANLPDRRKALIFASAGIPLEIDAAAPKLIGGATMNGDLAGAALSLFHDLEKTFEAAQRANVNIYSLDPGGLRAPIAQHNAFEGTGELNGRPGTPNRDFLHAVSANTGGFVLTETNSFEQGIAQIFRENSSYYLLGYEPSGPRSAGRFRRVDVRVERPGVTVRARSGYYEPDASRPDKRDAGAASLDKALSAIVPTSDLPLQATAASFALGGRKQAAVAVVVAVRQSLARSTERVIDEVAAQVQAYDSAGTRRANDALSGRVVLRPGPGGEMVFELLSRLDLDPGHYQLRIAATSSLDRSKSGSVYCDIDVPNFRDDRLSLSGIVLTADPGVIAARKEALASLLPVVPTSLRGFIGDQRVGAFLRVYEGGSDPIRRVAIRTSIRDSRDQIVFEQTAEVGGDQFSSARAADYQVQLPVRDLKPGPHVLTIEATAGKETARRDVRFAVR